MGIRDHPSFATDICHGTEWSFLRSINEAHMQGFRQWAMIAVISLLLPACRGYLDVAPKDKIIPKSLKDFQLLLDDGFNMNLGPELPLASADEMSMPDQQYSNLSFVIQ